MSLCFLILSLTQDIYSDVYSRILNFIQISNWTYCNIKCTCICMLCKWHTSKSSSSILALFRLNWCSIQCSGWCSSWQVSLDSLDEYWRRSCFLIESSFAFHNAMNMCGCFFTGQSLSLIVTPSLSKPFLSNSKSDTYQSFKSNIKMKKEQIAYKTEQSILFDLISLCYIQWC